MSACYTSSTGSGTQDFSSDSSTTRRILIAVSDELLAAVEGWRQVHGVEQSEAIGTLVRLGLLSEVAKIYRLVSRPPSPASKTATVKRPKRAENQAGALNPP